MLPTGLISTSLPLHLPLEPSGCVVAISGTNGPQQHVTTSSSSSSSPPMTVRMPSHGLFCVPSVYRKLAEMTIPSSSATAALSNSPPPPPPQLPTAAKTKLYVSALANAWGLAKDGDIPHVSSLFFNAMGGGVKNNSVAGGGASAAALLCLTPPTTDEVTANPFSARAAAVWAPLMAPPMMVGIGNASFPSASAALATHPPLLTSSSAIALSGIGITGSNNIVGSVGLVTPTSASPPPLPAQQQQGGGGGKAAANSTSSGGVSKAPTARDPLLLLEWLEAVNLVVNGVGSEGFDPEALWPLTVSGAPSTDPQASSAFPPHQHFANPYDARNARRLAKNSLERARRRVTLTKRSHAHYTNGPTAAGTAGPSSSTATIGTNGASKDANIRGVATLTLLLELVANGSGDIGNAAAASSSLSGEDATGGGGGAFSASLTAGSFASSGILGGVSCGDGNSGAAELTPTSYAAHFASSLPSSSSSSSLPPALHACETAELAVAEAILTVLYNLIHPVVGLAVHKVPMVVNMGGGMMVAPSTNTNGGQVNNNTANTASSASEPPCLNHVALRTAPFQWREIRSEIGRLRNAPPPPLVKFVGNGGGTTAVMANAGDNVSYPNPYPHLRTIIIEGFHVKRERSLPTVQKLTKLNAYRPLFMLLSKHAALMGGGGGGGNGNTYSAAAPTSPSSASSPANAVNVATMCSPHVRIVYLCSLLIAALGGGTKQSEELAAADRLFKGLFDAASPSTAAGGAGANADGSGGGGDSDDDGGGTGAGDEEDEDGAGGGGGKKKKKKKAKKDGGFCGGCSSGPMKLSGVLGLAKTGTLARLGGASGALVAALNASMPSLTNGNGIVSPSSSAPSSTVTSFASGGGGGGNNNMTGSLRRSSGGAGTSTIVGGVGGGSQFVAYGACGAGPYSTVTAATTAVTTTSHSPFANLGSAWVSQGHRVHPAGANGAVSSSGGAATVVVTGLHPQTFMAAVLSALATIAVGAPNISFLYKKALLPVMGELMTRLSSQPTTSSSTDDDGYNHHINSDNANNNHRCAVSHQQHHNCVQPSVSALRWAVELFYRMLGPTPSRCGGEVMLAQIAADELVAVKEVFIREHKGLALLMRVAAMGAVGGGSLSSSSSSSMSYCVPFPSAPLLCAVLDTMGLLLGIPSVTTAARALPTGLDPLLSSVGGAAVLDSRVAALSGSLFISPHQHSASTVNGSSTTSNATMTTVPSGLVLVAPGGRAAVRSAPRIGAAGWATLITHVLRVLDVKEMPVGSDNELAWFPPPELVAELKKQQQLLAAEAAAKASSASAANAANNGGTAADNDTDNASPSGEAVAGGAADGGGGGDDDSDGGDDDEEAEEDDDLPNEDISSVTGLSDYSPELKYRSLPSADGSSSAAAAAPPIPSHTTILGIASVHHIKPFSSPRPVPSSTAVINNSPLNTEPLLVQSEAMRCEAIKGQLSRVLFAPEHAEGLRVVYDDLTRSVALPRTRLTSVAAGEGKTRGVGWSLPPVSPSSSHANLPQQPSWLLPPPSASAQQQKQQQPSSAAVPLLTFDSSFESGNLKRAIHVLGGTEYDLILHADVNTNSFVQWFYFAIGNITPNVPYRFNIINMEKESSTFNDGQRPLLFSERRYEASSKKVGWTREGHHIAYYKNAIARKPRERYVAQELMDITTNTATTTTAATGSSKNATAGGSKAGGGGSKAAAGAGKGSSATASAAAKRRSDASTPVSAATGSSSGAKSSAAAGKSSSGGDSAAPTAAKKKGKKPSSGSDNNGTYYTLTFTIVFPHANDRVYLCNCYPYTYSDLIGYCRRLITSHEEACQTITPTTATATSNTNTPPLSVSASPAAASAAVPPTSSSAAAAAKVITVPPHCLFVQSLCPTLSGNATPLLTVTSLRRRDANNTPYTEEEIRQRPIILLTARVHPGESNASYMIKGTMDLLLSPTNAVSQLLRDQFVFKIIPMLNPDGVINGNHRCGLAGTDLNRGYHKPSRFKNPTIYHLKALAYHMKKVEGRTVLLYTDFHGHSRCHNGVIYGCGEGNSLQSLFGGLMPPVALMNGSGALPNNNTTAANGCGMDGGTTTTSLDGGPVVGGGGGQVSSGQTLLQQQQQVALLRKKLTKKKNNADILAEAYGFNATSHPHPFAPPPHGHHHNHTHGNSTAAISHLLGTYGAPERMLPLLLEYFCPYFSYGSSTFTMQKGKRNTGRVVFYRQMGVRMSYTVEASMMGGIGCDFATANAAACDDFPVRLLPAQQRLKGGSHHIAGGRGGGGGEDDDDNAASMGSLEDETEKYIRYVLKPRPDRPYGIAAAVSSSSSSSSSAPPQFHQLSAEQQRRIASQWSIQNDQLSGLVATSQGTPSTPPPPPPSATAVNSTAPPPHAPTAILLSSNAGHFAPKHYASIGMMLLKSLVYLWGSARPHRVAMGGTPLEGPAEDPYYVLQSDPHKGCAKAKGLGQKVYSSLCGGGVGVASPAASNSVTSPTNTNAASALAPSLEELLATHCVDPDHKARLCGLVPPMGTVLGLLQRNAAEEAALKDLGKKKKKGGSGSSSKKKLRKKSTTTTTAGGNGSGKKSKSSGSKKKGSSSCTTANNKSSNKAAATAATGNKAALPPSTATGSKRKVPPPPQQPSSAAAAKSRTNSNAPTPAPNKPASRGSSNVSSVSSSTTGGGASSGLFGSKPPAASSSSSATAAAPYSGASARQIPSTAHIGMKRGGQGLTSITAGLGGVGGGSRSHSGVPPRPSTHQQQFSSSGGGGGGGGGGSSSPQSLFGTPQHQKQKHNAAGFNTPSSLAPLPAPATVSSIGAGDNAGGGCCVNSSHLTAIVMSPVSMVATPTGAAAVAAGDGHLQQCFSGSYAHATRKGSQVPSVASPLHTNSSSSSNPNPNLGGVPTATTEDVADAGEEGEGSGAEGGGGGDDGGGSSSSDGSGSGSDDDEGEGEDGEDDVPNAEDDDDGDDEEEDEDGDNDDDNANAADDDDSDLLGVGESAAAASNSDAIIGGGHHPHNPLSPSIASPVGSPTAAMPHHNGSATSLLSPPANNAQHSSAAVIATTNAKPMPLRGGANLGTVAGGSKKAKTRKVVKHAPHGDVLLFCQQAFVQGPVLV